MMRPFSSWVCALNALQNSMMFTPCWPSAGPTGGAGLAAPPGTWSLMSVRTFLAIARASLDGRFRGPRARGGAPDQADQGRRAEGLLQQVEARGRRDAPVWRVIRACGGRGIDHQIFLTWSNPTSTGVSRPKIETSTFSLLASSLISAISPEKSDSGPETTLTDSPTEN